MVENPTATVMARVRIIGGIAILAIVVLGVAYEMEPFRHDAIAFENHQCEPDRKGQDTYQAEWDKFDLVVRATERATCGQSVSSVSAYVVAGQIILRLTYSSPPGRPAAACMCGYVTTIRLSGLEKRGYSVRRIGWAYP